jgi:hypothetical protein
MEVVQLYRMCLLKKENYGTQLNKFIKIQHAQLGRKLHFDSATWEIKGVCSSLVKHDEMVAYVEKYNKEKKKDE